MNILPISIIIPVSKDIKIKKCLESIKDNAEILVVLNNNPSEEVLEIVENDKRCVSMFLNTTGCNLAQVINLGVEKAKNERIFIMNSDCIFSEEILRKANASLVNFDVVKAHIIFLHSTYLELLVARVRHLHNHIFNNNKSIFCPGMAFNKKIIGELDGYLFDENMGWGEDGDLSRRIHKANLPYIFLKEEIMHAPESLFRDLKAAFRIGRGKRVRDYKDNISLLKGVKNMFLEIVLDKKQHIRISLKNERFMVTIYLLFWKVSYFLGYFYLINSKNISSLWIKK